VARFPSNSYGRRKSRNLKWVYGISALFIIAGVITFIYGRPFGKNEEEIPVDAAKINVENKTKPPPVISPKPTVKRTVEPKPTVKRTVEPKPTVERVVEPTLSNTIAVATSEANPKVAELIDEAMALVNTTPSRIIEARDRLNEAFSMPMNNVQRTVVKQRLSELADKWLFSRTVFPQDKLCYNYQVKPGELLSAISNLHKVPWEIIQEINNISRPELLKAGQIIKIIRGPFHAKVYRSTFTVDVYLQNTFVRSFRVGLGQEGKETPTGLWSVKPGGKLIKPPWSDPATGRLLHYGDQDYALGSRWIALDGLQGNAKGRTGFGIHGTIEPETIGTKSSKGCIRLHNGDVVKLYNLLTEVHSLVRVID
jgi:lipoprotein-anchoring transpeptidase ErfK/SrfK